MALGTLRDSGIKVGDGLHGDAELGHEGVPQEGVGGDAPLIGGQCHGTLDGLERGGDTLGRAHVGGPEEVLQGGAPRELGGFEGGPAAEAVAKERRIFLLQPLQDRRDGVFQRTGQAIRQTDCVADQATAVFDALGQGPPSGALGGEGGARVPVCEEQLHLQFGIGRVVFRPARGKRVAVLGPGERIDGKKHKAIICAQRRHDRALVEFQAHGKRVAIAPRAQALGPRVARVGAVCEPQTRPSGSAGDW
jgi:hypothetical protein